MKRYLTIFFVVVLLFSVLPTQALALEMDSPVMRADYARADLDCNGSVDDEDVIYLLWHTLMPADYSVSVNVDFDNNGTVDDEDVIYLLWHTLMPNDYPIEDQKPVLSYEEYIKMTSDEQTAYRKTFDSTQAFFEWYNAAKAEYDEKNAGIDIGDGSVDLGDIIGGNSK